MPLRRPETLRQLAALTADVKDQIVRARAGLKCSAEFARWREQIDRQLNRQSDPLWWADSLAQALVCGEWAVRLSAQAVEATDGLPVAGPSGIASGTLEEHLRDRFRHLFPLADSPALNDIAGQVHDLNFEALLDDKNGRFRGDAALHGYEHFLAVYDGRSRTQSGVYYTPSEVVRFLVQSSDEALKRDFGLLHGLADERSWRVLREQSPRLEPGAEQWEDEPFVRILDPACGTGAFLTETVTYLHHTWSERWRAGGCPAGDLAARWAQYVRRHLLGRLIGFEVMMAPWAIAHVRMAAALAATGCWLGDDEQPRIYLTDTLADPKAVGTNCERPPTGGGLSEGLAAAKDREPITVVIGNPPYAGISDNQDQWIRGLMRGTCPDDPHRRSYYQVDGRPLGERKLWLTDDYVKFLRYGQWRIDRAGAGIVAFVTNHGLLDNATFRGARQSLMQTFSHLSLVDLHGNVKKRERVRESATDESVFATEQGMAVSLLCRVPPVGETNGRCRIDRGDLWGSAEFKRQALQTSTASQIATREISPRPPDYVFVERDATHQVEYEAGYRVPDVMPVGTTAVVTARDRLVVGFTDEEVLARIQQLRDPALTDDVLRERFFPKRRSPKYPAGDTRGWKLNDSRRRLRADDRWRDHVTSCLYRPFDCRSLYWHDRMVDWPRAGVMRHLTAGANVALIARRQMLAGHECNYFWVTDRITIDGVIRSDNRGTESVFPLFLYDDLESPPCPSTNLSAEFARAAERVLPGRPIGVSADQADMAGPVRWLGFLYAQFFSRTYRRRYADLLRTDFPRVFVTPREDLWDELSALGCQLIIAHLDANSPARILFGTAANQDLSGPVAREVSLVAQGPAEVGPGFPKFEDGRVLINRESHFDGVPEPVWRFCVGGHQVCRKWLKDRRGRLLTDADLAQYARIVTAIGQTIEMSSRIDEAIERRGGWREAFGLPITGDA